MVRGSATRHGPTGGAGGDPVDMDVLPALAYALPKRRAHARLRGRTRAGARRQAGAGGRAIRPGARRSGAGHRGPPRASRRLDAGHVSVAAGAAGDGAIRALSFYRGAGPRAGATWWTAPASHPSERAEDPVADRHRTGRRASPGLHFFFGADCLCVEGVFPGSRRHQIDAQRPTFAVRSHLGWRVPRRRDVQDDREPRIDEQLDHPGGGGQAAFRLVVVPACTTLAVAGADREGHLGRRGQERVAGRRGGGRGGGACAGGASTGGGGRAGGAFWASLVRVLVSETARTADADGRDRSHGDQQGSAPAALAVGGRRGDRLGHRRRAEVVAPGR